MIQVITTKGHYLTVRIQTGFNQVQDQIPAAAPHKDTHTITLLNGTRY